MRVEIWSDVVCPWCYVGKRRFDAAVAAVAGEVDLEITYRAYQLDPHAPPGVATPAPEVYARKFGGPDTAARIFTHLREVADTAGIDMRLDQAVRANTTLAHRMLWRAGQPDSPIDQGVLEERLMAAYFTEGRNVADPDVLAELAGEVGWDPDGVHTFLESDEGLGAVREEQAQAAALGISAVPTYVIEGRWAIPGAQDTEVFEQVLRRSAARLADAGSEQAAPG